MKTLACQNEDGLCWGEESPDGREGKALVDLLVLCAAENLPVIFG